MKKRLVILLMAGLLALGGAVPALAGHPADGPGGDQPTAAAQNGADGLRGSPAECLLTDTCP